MSYWIARALGCRLLPLRAEAGVVHPLMARLQYTDYQADPRRARERVLQTVRLLDDGAGRWREGIVNLFGPTSGGDQSSAWLRWDGRSARVVQAVVVSPVTSFQVLKRLAISRRYSWAWSR
jgi:hypothetical protein